MAKMTKKKPAKKVASKGAKRGGAAELAAFKAAIQNMKATGAALAKAAKVNKGFGSTVGVRSALNSAQDAIARIVKSIPVDPPTTTVQQ
jgi:hypothetical protein